MHNCRLTWTDSRGVDHYTYICSRCGGCYVCKHKAVYFADADKWMWKCKTGKFQEVILDGRQAK